MTPAQSAYKVFAAHQCEVCDQRIYWTDPRCPEGTRLFLAWDSACNEIIAQQQRQGVMDFEAK